MLAFAAPNQAAVKGKKKGKKKKACPPCKTRKQGKCKKKRPNGAACRGGTCQQGACIPSAKRNFTVSGRSIIDPSGNPVLFRGINKMSVYEDVDPIGTISFPEIRKTGANSVRIVWAITKDNGAPSEPSVLDALITNAIANKLVPMIELHDGTGDLSRLDDLVAYWTQQPIVNIIEKHREYLLVNIGNEVGDNLVTDAQFVTAYTSAVQTMRSAGIHTPLVIDAPDWGKNLTVLNNTAATLLSADPDHNLIFSVHLYWGIAEGRGAQYIRTRLEEAVALNYPLIVGEFSQYGAYNGGASICSTGGAVDYRAILLETHRLSIGWYAWEWGPENALGNPPDPLCAIMDMTPDRMFANLKPGWAQEVATTSQYSIKNTSVSVL